MIAGQTPPATGPRLWEIDLLRGITVILMIIFHLSWDLQFLGLAEVDVFSRPWQIFARGIGSTFTFLLGLSLTLTAARLGRDVARHALRRGLLLIGLGMVVTVATFLSMGESYVRFGILHLLGAATLLALPFLAAPAALSFVVGLAMIAVGFWLDGLVVGHPWLIWLGVTQAGVAMVDYYPLLPWAGFALLGVAAGKLIYPGGRRRVALPDRAGLPLVRLIRWLGSHSLLIYLLHQPVLLAILFGLSWAFDRL